MCTDMLVVDLVRAQHVATGLSSIMGHLMEHDEHLGGGMENPTSHQLSLCKTGGEEAKQCCPLPVYRKWPLRSIIIFLRKQVTTAPGEPLQTAYKYWGPRASTFFDCGSISEMLIELRSHILTDDAADTPLCLRLGSIDNSASGGIFPSEPPLRVAV